MINEYLIENYTNLPTTVLNGAKRVELTAAKTLGGTTVSKGVMSEASRYTQENQVHLDIYIAPRTGLPVYDDTEIKIMESDLLQAQQSGVDGVVFIALDPHHQLDEDAMDQLIAAAGGMEISVSSNFDLIAPDDQEATLNWFASHGVDRLFSRGGDGLLVDRLNALKNLKTITDKIGITLVPSDFSAVDIEEVQQILGPSQIEITD